MDSSRHSSHPRKSVKFMDDRTIDEAESGAPSEEVLAKWETVAMDEREFDKSAAGETISARDPYESFRRRQLLGELPRIDPGDGHSQFELKTTLGEGGMGVVRLARQTSLFRNVALKTVRPDQLDSSATQELLQESWVTGMLEHPNIVPVHALGVD